MSNKMDIEKPANYEEELQKLEDAIKNAEENYGDTEVRDAIMSKAEFFQKHGEEEKAIKTYQEAYEKSVGVSKRLEIYMIYLQIYFKSTNLEEIKNYIRKSKALLEEGGDWENKNKLKVYEGLYNLITRDFTGCARLFVDAMSTFQSPEIMSYEDLTFYTVVSGLMTLPRSEIKEKIINNSEILCIIRENKVLEGFLNAYYKCHYKEFFQYFLKVIDLIEADNRIRIHKKYIIKEMRVMIYSLFLESYKTVTLERMASQFGVSPTFLDKELSSLISSRRLNCKIDKVTGLIECQRIDQRNNYYNSALKQGEALLNRIQKLSRVGDV